MYVELVFSPRYGYGAIDDQSTRNFQSADDIANATAGVTLGAVAKDGVNRKPSNVASQGNLAAPTQKAHAGTASRGGGADSAFANLQASGAAATGAAATGAAATGAAATGAAATGAAAVRQAAAIGAAATGAAATGAAATSEAAATGAATVGAAAMGAAAIGPDVMGAADSLVGSANEASTAIGTGVGAEASGISIAPDPHPGAQADAPLDFPDGTTTCNGACAETRSVATMNMNESIGDSGKRVLHGSDPPVVNALAPAVSNANTDVSKCITSSGAIAAATDANKNECANVGAEASIGIGNGTTTSASVCSTSAGAINTATMLSGAASASKSGGKQSASIGGASSKGATVVSTGATGVAAPANGRAGSSPAGKKPRRPVVYVMNEMQAGPTAVETPIATLLTIERFLADGGGADPEASHESWRHPGKRAAISPSKALLQKALSEQHFYKRMDAVERQQHMQLWARRRAKNQMNDKLLQVRTVASTSRRGDNEKDYSLSLSSSSWTASPHLSFDHELRSDPKGVGFAYGGVSPGTLHARGQLVRVHTVHYSVGLAGTYRLHVGLRQQSVALPGSPFTLEVLPGSPYAPSTRLPKESLPLRGVVGEKWRGMTMWTYDKVGNQCIKGGSKVNISVDSDQVQADSIDNGDGSYSFKWRSERAGTYVVGVTIDGLSVLGSPTPLTMLAANLDVHHCEMSGSGLTNAVAGIPAMLRIKCKDKYANAATPAMNLKFGISLTQVRLDADLEPQHHKAYCVL